MGVDRLYYNTLGDQEKAAYDILVRGFQGRQSIVNVPHKRDSALEPLFRAIKYEHPELYYADLYATEVYRNALFEEYHLKYRYSEEETREKDRKIAAAVQSILRDTKGISEYKREKLIHDRIVMGNRRRPCIKPTASRASFWTVWQSVKGSPWHLSICAEKSGFPAR